MRKRFQHKIFLPGIKLTTFQLVIVASIAIVLLIINQLTINKFEKPEKTEMVSASLKMREAQNLLQLYRKQKGFEVNNQMDPLQTGFIGTEFSPITTTLGNLNSKQTSTNPDFAALFIHWFHILKLKKSDQIIIHISGSFPALGIAAIIAAETYQVKPVILSSAGASSFGANIPEFTFWDIESYLFEEGIINHKTQYATPGGQDDNGSSFWENGLQLTINAAERNFLQINIPKNLSEAIAEKISYINSQKHFNLFINIGGSHSALGTVPCSMQLTNGLITEPIRNSNTNCSGLVQMITQMGIPVIHMLNIRDLALENGIDLIPTYNHVIGEDDIYFTQKKSKVLMGFSIIIIILIIGAVVKGNGRSNNNKEFTYMKK